MEEVVKSGYLIKKGHVVPTMKKRFFQLNSFGVLKYYTDVNGKLKGQIVLQASDVITPVIKSKREKVHICMFL